MNTTDTRKINILIVDDRLENLVALEAILDDEQYHLVKANSGEEALKWLLVEKFALILLDVQMPGMDGFTTAKLIKAREKTKHIPILFITANSLESKHIFMGYSVGAVDYILKPVDPLILKSKVKRFVEIYTIKEQLIEQKGTLKQRTKELQSSNQQLQQTTDKLRISEALANIISDTAVDTMLIFDETGKILKANDAAKQHLRYSGEELLTSHISQFFQEQEAQHFIENLLRSLQSLTIIKQNDRGNTFTITRKDGTTFLGAVQIGMKIIQETTILACTIRDITKEKQDEALIKQMAYHDMLTELPNRRAFNKQLEKEINKGRALNQPVNILYLDMDRFKNINDSLGHAIGDKALIAVAQTLRSTIADSGFVARIGGDEFTIILPGMSREDALEIADNILDALNEPLTIEKYELFITTSIGLSTFPYDGKNGKKLLRHADAALYQAKEQGKNKYRIYHAGMNIQSYRSFMMQNDLRKAMELGEFEIYYQPRVEVATGKISSAEALLRRMLKKKV